MGAMLLDRPEGLHHDHIIFVRQAFYLGPSEVGEKPFRGNPTVHHGVCAAHIPSMLGAAKGGYRGAVLVDGPAMSADLYRQVRKAEDIAIANSPIQSDINQTLGSL
jgi:hypothetical protein